MHTGIPVMSVSEVPNADAPIWDRCTAIAHNSDHAIMMSYNYADKSWVCRVMCWAPCAGQWDNKYGASASVSVGPVRTPVCFSCCARVITWNG